MGEMGSYSRVPASDALLDVFTIHVKANEGDWDVDTEGSWTIGQLKQHIKEKYELSGKRVRLISSGRLLEDQNTVSSYGLKEGDFVHAAIAEDYAHESRIDIPGNRRGSRGDYDGDSDDDELERGFDRLAHTGFSPQEIQFLRQQFHARRGMFIQSMSREEMLSYEEQWFQENTRDEETGGFGSQSGRFNRFDSAMTEGREGTQADLVIGVVMGFVFGIVMLFFLFDRGISRQQKFGIFMGIGVNFVLGMMKVHTNTRGAGGFHPAGNISRHGDIMDVKDQYSP